LIYPKSLSRLILCYQVLFAGPFTSQTVHIIHF